jgi:hypothetical protein
LFTDFSKLLICGGYYKSGQISDTCEVINLESTTTTCKDPPNFPATVNVAIGGIGFKENPIICSGFQNTFYSNKCYSLENNEWASFPSMNSARSFAAADQLQDRKLLVTGGLISDTAEMLTEEGWESKIPSLPFIINFHCMVTVNSTTVMVIGGNQNELISAKVFYFTFGDASWTEGPEMKHKRAYQSCGRIRSDINSQETSIIVAGGLNGSYPLTSVEILDEGSNRWQKGHALPLGIYLSQMVEDPNGGVVLIGGSSSSTVHLDTLYHLPHGGLDAVWTKMEQKLKIGRWQHTAFLVPDNSVECCEV